MLNRLQGVFESLHRHDVRYVVMGGIAAVLYGVPRATFDLDLLIDATQENVERLLRAFIDAGLGTADLVEPAEVLANEITIFKDRVRVDIFTTTMGLDFEHAWSNKVSMDYRGQSFYVVSKEDLKAAKRAAGRTVDLEDVRLLELPD